MRKFGTTAVFLLLAGVASAGSIHFSRHDAAGSGTAQVFDGGPARTAAGHTIGAHHSMSFVAVDETRVGSYGGIASASGSSYVTELGETMEVTVDLNAAYVPSFLPGGDRPGGTAEAEINSVIEFALPAEELIWFHVLNSRVNTGFSGSAFVLVENISSSETLLSLSGTEPETWTTIIGQPDDLIRITTIMSGSGSAPSTATSPREYNARMKMIFEIPEPATATLLALGGCLLMSSKRRCRTRSHRRHTTFTP